MIEIGKINKLEIVHVDEYGLSVDAGEFGDMFLPAKEIDQPYGVGDKIELFLYKDNNDQLSVTTRKPFACVGEFAYLEVVDVPPVGAFLNWGMPKDLFVSFNEQIEEMSTGEFHLVYLFYDKERDRVAATAYYRKFIDEENILYKANDPVDLLICEETVLGYNAIINNQHIGLLYNQELYQDLEVGQKLKGYIKKVRDDGKIDLCLQKQGYEKPKDLSEQILTYMKNNGGISDITDKSDPDLIADTFGVSKKKFKMAIGLLYKERKILVEGNQLKLVEK